MKKINTKKNNKIVTTIRKKANLDNENNNFFGGIKEQSKQLGPKNNELGVVDKSANNILKIPHKTNNNSESNTINNNYTTENYHSVNNTSVQKNYQNQNNLDKLNAFSKALSPIKRNSPNSTIDYFENLPYINESNKKSSKVEVLQSSPLENIKDKQSVTQKTLFTKRNSFSESGSSSADFAVMIPINESNKKSTKVVENTNDYKRAAIKKTAKVGNTSVEAPKLSRKEYGIFQRRKSSVAAINDNTKVTATKPMNSSKAESITKLFENTENTDLINMENLSKEKKKRCVCSAGNVVLGIFLALMCCVWLAALAVSIYYYVIDPSTLKHWKIYGIISSSYFIILTIITSIFAFFIRKEKKPIEYNLEMDIVEVKVERPVIKQNKVNEVSKNIPVNVDTNAKKNREIEKIEKIEASVVKKTATPEKKLESNENTTIQKTVIHKLISNTPIDTDNRVYVIKKPPRHYFTKSSFKSNQMPFVKVLSDSVINRRAEPVYFDQDEIIENQNQIQYVDPRFIKTSVSAPAVPAVIIKKRKKPKRIVVRSGYPERHNTISGYPSDQGYIMMSNNKVMRVVNNENDLMYDDDDDDNDINDRLGYQIVDSNGRRYYQ